MKNQSWTFTSIEDGQPVQTVQGLSHAQAVEAIHAAMHGYDSIPKLQEIASRKGSEQETVTLLAA